MPELIQNFGTQIPNDSIRAQTPGPGDAFQIGELPLLTNKSIV